MQKRKKTVLWLHLIFFLTSVRLNNHILWFLDQELRWTCRNGQQGKPIKSSKQTWIKIELKIFGQSRLITTEIPPIWTKCEFSSSLYRNGGSMIRYQTIPKTISRSCVERKWPSDSITIRVSERDGWSPGINYTLELIVFRWCPWALLIFKMLHFSVSLFKWIQ